SGQRGQTVNLLAYAFDGSNPSPTTIFQSHRDRTWIVVGETHGRQGDKFFDPFGVAHVLLIFSVGFTHGYPSPATSRLAIRRSASDVRLTNAPGLLPLRHG